jgi:hypothetical protein
LNNDQVVDIWDEADLIPPGNALIFPHTDKACNFIVVKGSCLVVSTVGHDGNILRKGAQNFDTMGITGMDYGYKLLLYLLTFQF